MSFQTLNMAAEIRRNAHLRQVVEVQSIRLQWVLDTGNLYKAVPRFRECGMHVEAEEVSNSRNKIHQTWEQPYRDSL